MRVSALFLFSGRNLIVFISCFSRGYRDYTKVQNIEGGEIMKVQERASGKVERARVYEAMDSFEMFNSDGVLEARWRGPFEGYR